MKRAFLSVSLAALVAGAAGLSTTAADAGFFNRDSVLSLKDAPLAPVTSWTGFYIGGNVGYAWGSSGLEVIRKDIDDDDDDDDDNGIVIVDPTGGNGAPNVFSLGLDNEDWVGGAHLGINQQFGQFVVGGEIAFWGGDLSETGVFDGDTIGRTDISQVFEAVLRGGYAWDNYLGYIRAGYASAKVESVVSSDEDGGVFFQGDERHEGFVVGIGLEAQIQPGVVLGLQYDYLDLEGENHGGFELDDEEFHVNVDVDDIQTVKARISFLIGPDAPVMETFK